MPTSGFLIAPYLPSMLKMLFSAREAGDLLLMRLFASKLYTHRRKPRPAPTFVSCTVADNASRIRDGSANTSCDCTARDVVPREG